jgi:hypothetical protein
MAEPPLFNGAVQLSATWAFPRTALSAVGDPGTVASGVAGSEATEAAEVPAALVAVTVKVYAVPLSSPVIKQEVAEEHGTAVFTVAPI